MIADDFKAIRERRDQLGGQDIIKEYATPASEREPTRVEKLLAACPPGTVHLGTITAGTCFGMDDLQGMMARKLPDVFNWKPAMYIGRSGMRVRFIGADHE